MRPPDWVIEAVERSVKAMGLDRWEVLIHWQGDMERLAVNELQPEYEAALLRVDADTVEGQRGRRIILHEVAHMQHSPLYTAWEYVLAMVPEDQRELARKMLDEADELVIEREASAWERELYAARGGCTCAASCGIMDEVVAGQEPPTKKETTDVSG